MLSDINAQGCGYIRLLWIQLLCRICHGDCDHYHDLMKTGTVRYNLHLWGLCKRYCLYLYSVLMWHLQIALQPILYSPEAPTAKAPSTTWKYSPSPLSKLLTSVKLLQAGRMCLGIPHPALQQNWRMDMGLRSLTPHPPCLPDQLDSN